MGDIEKVKIFTYYPTLMSLRRLIRNLKLQPEHYHLDVMTMRLYIHSKGLILQPGDCYHVSLEPRKF